MKHTLIIIIEILFVSNIFSQSDSIEKPVFWVRPYFETGVTFINNDILKESYATNSMFNWGAGIRIGNPNKSRLLPYVQYSNSSFTTQNIDVNSIKIDSTLNIQEFIAGFNFIIKRIKSNNFTTKFAYIHSTINDDLFVNSGSANGLQIGFGYEANFFGNSRVFINYSYDFLKYGAAAFRDYDIQKISIGFMH